MSENKLRKEPVCLNCGQTVEDRFCSSCGQENTEVRQTFGYLFSHFFKDLTHYDSSFWKTLKSLLFKPGKLTQSYLEGKRKAFVNPIRLYIFISFITFFLFAALSQKDTFSFNLKGNSNSGIYIQEANMEVNSVHQLDSLQSTQAKQPNVIYKVYRKMLEVGGSKNFAKAFISGFYHNIPKTLFIYLPIFAFFLWLFHNKKKWWYFDHGIFTLHYFSYLLLAATIYLLLKNITHTLNINWLFVVTSIISFTILIYSFLYFFIAHHRVYKATKTNSILKGSLLFLINAFLLIILTIALLLFTFFTL